MSRARIPEGLLAVAAVMLAAWPITTLLTGTNWVRPVLLMVLLQAAVGMVLRAVGAPRVVIIVSQVFAVLIGTSLTHLRGDLAPGDFPAAVGDLFNDASETLTRYAAPAPATTGIVFALTLFIPLIGVLVDFLSATLRMPAAAGLPLLGLFLFSTSNTGDALNPVYFIALAIVWLMMLARGGVQLMRRWSSTEAYSRSPERLEDRFGISGYSSTARWIGVGTILAAVILPTFIPHLPPRYITDGLARTSSGSNGKTGTVGFTDSLDLTLDLNSQDQKPVLRYTTADLTPPPLKVLNMSMYSSGSWVRQDPPRRVPGENDEPIPRPTGMAAAAPKTTSQASITTNGLAAPYVAVPAPISKASFDKTSWSYDPATTNPQVDKRPNKYNVSYLELAPDARPATGHDPDPNVPAADQRTDTRSRGLVTQLADSATKGRTTDFAKAIAIQNWLRSSSFTYSLTLAPTRQGPDGRPLDPISNFLETRRGYCTQFATAMVMMARSQDIPARMAVGFLPGTKSGNTFEVKASDAHAWPELYFPGLGWTRFEPTPSSRSGSVPDYAQSSTTGASGLPGREVTEEDPSTTTSAQPSTTTSAAPTQGAGGGGQDDSFFTARGLLIAFLALLIGAAGAIVLPLAARWRREQPLRAATDPREQVEGEWHVLQSRLHDLGIDSPQGRTPRQAERHYRQNASLDGEGRAALHRAVQTLEAVRYAPPGGATRSLDQDADLILRDVRASASLPARISATVFPRTGRESVRTMARRAWGVPLRWLDQAADRVVAWRKK